MPRFHRDYPQGHDGHCEDHGGRRHARGEFWPGGRGGHRGLGGRGEQPSGDGHGGHHSGGGRGGHQGGPGRGGRLGRLFAHGDLHFVILHLIAEKPRHGYEIIKAIEEMTGGAYAPSPGTIYPALTMLEDQGYLSQSADGAKKLNDITEDGRAYLAANQPSVEMLVARIRQAGAERGRGVSPRIIRAVENLRLALHLRLEQGELTEEQVLQLVDALDRATIAVEGV